MMTRLDVSTRTFPRAARAAHEEVAIACMEVETASGWDVRELRRARIKALQDQPAPRAARIG